MAAPALTATNVPDEYKAIAPFYNSAAAGFLAGPHVAAARLCRELGVRRALDVGCGTGLLTRRLSENLPFVVGLESSLSMLGKARQRGTGVCGKEPRSEGGNAEAGSGEKCFFIRADGGVPPFRSNSFDAVVYSLVLHESFTGGERLLERGFRLAPLAVVLDWSMPERNLDYLCSGWVHIIERLAGKEHYRRFRHYMRAGGLHGLAHRAGATVRQAVPLKGGSLVLAVLSRYEA